MPKFVHIRRVDGDGILLPKGGMTIAYSLVPWSDTSTYDVVFNVSVCSNKDLYDHSVGRMVSSQRLKDDGPIEVISGSEHPRAANLVSWIADNYYKNYVITILQRPLSPRKTKHGEVPRWRWESTFEPA